MLTYNRETGWVSLSDRRKKQRLKVFYKMTSGKAPEDLCNSIPVKEPGHNYNLRNEDQNPHIRGRTVFSDNTFIPKTIRDWNELPNNVRNDDSSEKFSNSIGKKSIKHFMGFCHDGLLSCMHVYENAVSSLKEPVILPHPCGRLSYL